MGGPSLPDRVAQYYYSHALFCSSHPIIAISVAIFAFLLCCYPLMYIPLPGSTPIKVSLPRNHEVLPINIVNDTEGDVPIGNHHKGDTSNNHNHQSKDKSTLSQLMNETSNLPYIWAKQMPLLYIQQIVLKSGVWPWRDELKLGDAFRAPLQEVFRMLDIIRNHQHPETGTSLGHVCYHVENVKRNTMTHKVTPILPEYNCLILSPANLWQRNLEKFSLDNNLLATVYNHQNLQKGKVSMAEMVFGMQLKDTGVKRYPLRARTRTIQYAVTLFFHQLNEGFIDSLKAKILSVYPTHQNWDQSQLATEINLIYYPGEFNYYEFVPLCLAFVGLFLYIYFSLRKIEFVKSKLGLAISAVVSVAACLIMSIGFCFFFGLTLSFQGKEIFPYLVILVGLENVFVLTKSVMSIDSKLDVKIRLAQGLSKEGWSITKNLLTEITILTISLFTFVPVIQQFSIFMIVSLLSDFLIQIFFFITVIGIDIKRKEMSRDQPTSFQFYVGPGKFIHQDFRGFHKKSSDNYDVISKNSQSLSNMPRSKSYPRLNGLVSSMHTDIAANNVQNPKSDIDQKTSSKLPKRIRLVNVWARTRFFQRAFMIWMIMWVSMITYSSGVIENLFHFDISSGDRDGTHPLDSITLSKESHRESNSDFLAEYIKKDGTVDPEKSKNSPKLDNVLNHGIPEPMSTKGNVVESATLDTMEFNSNASNKTLYFFSLKNMAYPQPWKRLSEFHWSSVLAQYNISIGGQYIAVLPPLLIKHRVTPEMAIAVQNPSEKDSFLPTSRWHALAAALDPLDTSDFEMEDGIPFIPHGFISPMRTNTQESEQPYYPTSPMELFLLSLLCVISIVVIAYTMLVMYRCVCTRNYAEWRTSWTDSDGRNNPGPALQVVMEAVPIVVHGHSQEVECLVTDGERIVSSCLQGSIKVWDSITGELNTKINRNLFFELQNDVCRKLLCDHDHEDGVFPGTMDGCFTDYQRDSEELEYLKRLENHSEPVLMDKPNKNWHNNFNFNKAFNKKSEDDRKYSSITGKAKTIYNFALQYRMLYEDNKTCSIDPLLTQRLENNIPCKDQQDSSLLTQGETHEDILNLELQQDDRNRNSNVASSGEVHSQNKTVKTDIEVVKKDPLREKHMVNPFQTLKEGELASNVTESSWPTAQDSPINSYVDSGDATTPAIWCMDFADDIIAIGCSSGRIETWEASTGKLLCMFDDGYSGGVSHLRLTQGEIFTLVVARLTGHLELLQLQQPPSQNNTHKRTHIRTGSAGSIPINRNHVYNRFSQRLPSLVKSSEPTVQGEGLGQDGLCCVRLSMSRAHQQPIAALECDGRRILTGSLDHTIKVFTMDELIQLYTLHGHCGPITCMFMDRFSPLVCGSGSQDGKLCVWDLMTGACVYSLQAHDGPISGLSYTASYVMSIGGDEKLCIWDRFRGHLLNTVMIGAGAGGCGLLTLTDSLVVTGGRGGLTVWDASTGTAVRKVHLGHNDGCVFVRQILPLKDSIVCDYANQLRIIRFPLVTKVDTNEITKCE